MQDSNICSFSRQIYTWKKTFYRTLWTKADRSLFSEVDSESKGFDNLQDSGAKGKTLENLNQTSPQLVLTVPRNTTNVVSNQNSFVLLVYVMISKVRLETGQ